MSKLSERGREIPDPTPVAMPIGFKRPEALVDQIRRFVRRELSESAAGHGYETFEESDDFDIEDDDDYDPQSPWELNFDQEREERPSAKRKRESAANGSEGKPSPSDPDSDDRDEARPSTNRRSSAAATGASNRNDHARGKGSATTEKRPAKTDDSRRSELESQFVEFMRWRESRQLDE